MPVAAPLSVVSIYRDRSNDHRSLELAQLLGQGVVADSKREGILLV